MSTLTPNIEPPVTPEEKAPAADNRWEGAWRDILGGGLVRSVLAVVLALFIGSLLVVIVNEDVQAAAGYFFSRPSDLLSAAWETIAGAFRAMWEGAVFSPRGGFKPLLSTLSWASPLIAAGLGLAVGFKAGLFNIGGRGQMLIAALFVGFVGSNLDMPFGLHLAVAVLGGIVGGALWASVVGVLKARTGAHEVIVTIMLNFVALYLVTWLLKTPVFQAENAGGNAKAKAIDSTAVFPTLIPGTDLDIGFVLALIAALVYWWLMERSTTGFRIRAVGLNPHAARTAGINIGRTYVVTLAASGAFIGLAGAMQVLGKVPAGWTPTVDAGIGFDAITVALLGANSAVGIVFAGLLFGALKAGSFPMQIAEGIPIDIVAVIQGLIVLFIAAPPLVRAIFRLPQPTRRGLRDRLRRPAPQTPAAQIQSASIDQSASTEQGASIDQSASTEEK
ncbi:ABC transporter permease [Salinibacterium sp. GXW1014]|uniref:ABC transporter permease n=1 Tax=Salinibacterium sp. GXW1014 TaxID=3377838 RepID=UPI00383B12C0